MTRPQPKLVGSSSAHDPQSSVSPSNRSDDQSESKGIALGPPIAHASSSSSLAAAKQIEEALSLPILTTTKPRTRTMSSTMSFSALFPPSSFASQSDHPRSSQDRHHGRYDSVDLNCGPGLASPDSDVSRNGEIVGSPFSITSDDGYMLGTPASPSQPLPYVHHQASGSLSASRGTDGAQGGFRHEKGKGKAREGDVDGEVKTGPGDVDGGENCLKQGTASSSRIGLALDPSPTNSGPSAIPTAVRSHVRPTPIHSFTYTGPSSSNIRLADNITTHHSSGRSTPTADSTASSIHGKLSHMRVKMKRKGSSLMDVIRSKDVERVAGRSRSGTTSSVATTGSVAGPSIPESPSAVDRSANSSKVNLRTRLVGKFDLPPRSGNNVGPLKYFKRNKSSSSPPAVALNSTGATVQAQSSGSNAIRTPLHVQTPTARVDADADNGGYDYFSAPLSPSLVDARSPICLGNNANGITLPPVSPILPVLAHTTSALMCREDGTTDPRVQNKLPNSDAVAEPYVAKRPSRFDDKLPRELKLQCFAALIDLHIAEHAKALRKAQGHSHESKERAIHYLSERWVGEMAGRRELFKIARVCSIQFHPSNYPSDRLVRCLVRGASSPLTVNCGRTQTSIRQSVIYLHHRCSPYLPRTKVRTFGISRSTGGATSRRARLHLQ